MIFITSTDNFFHTKGYIIKSAIEVIKLKTVIYADILIVVNIIVNYLLLRTSAAISGCNFKPLRFLLSAGAGGIFSLIIFVENINPILNATIRILFLSLMVLIAFGTKSVKSFLKCCGAFFLANFAFAGIMLGITVAVSPGIAIYKNGIVYFDINIFTLTITSVICYSVLSLISRFSKSKVPQKSIFPIRITYGGKTVEGKALLDTGNTLCDCFSGRPAIITEKDFISLLCENTELTEMKSFRLIPFTTIKNGGALPAFLADKTAIMDKGQWIETDNVYIAVTEKKIVSGGYSALLGMPFFDAIEPQIKGGLTVK
ncbi:MAG: hypothetical protein E7516_01750 [Ruminococcaceae bacterium]|nr:hypothetical protein [Oscillospiraceae bacterium]